MREDAGSPGVETAPPAAGRPRASFNHNVHGARGLFSVAVFCYHVHNSGLPTEPFLASGLLYEVLDVMKFGVELFFGISGIVILASLGRARTMLAFMIDRYSRILPVLWASIVVITALSVALRRPLAPPGVWLLSLSAPPPFIVIDRINPAAWSLGYEFTFYAFVALALFSLRRWGRATMWLVVAAGASLLVFYPRGLLLGSGVLVALRLLDAPALRRLSAAPFLWLALFAALWRVIELRYGGGDMAAVTPLQVAPAQWLPALALMLLAGAAGTLALLGVEGGRGWLSRILRTPLLQWLGLISYSFYLWHPVVMAGVKAMLKASHGVEAAGPLAQAAFFVLALPPSLLVAHVSQKLIEVRMTAWLRRRLGTAHRSTPAPNIPLPAPTAVPAP